MAYQALLDLNNEDIKLVKVELYLIEKKVTK